MLACSRSSDSGPVGCAYLVGIGSRCRSGVLFSLLCQVVSQFSVSVTHTQLTQPHHPHFHCFQPGTHQFRHHAGSLQPLYQLLTSLMCFHHRFTSELLWPSAAHMQGTSWSLSHDQH